MNVRKKVEIRPQGSEEYESDGNLGRFKSFFFAFESFFTAFHHFYVFRSCFVYAFAHGYSIHCNNEKQLCQRVNMK